MVELEKPRAEGYGCTRLHDSFVVMYARPVYLNLNEKPACERLKAFGMI